MGRFAHKRNIAEGLTDVKLFVFFKNSLLQSIGITEENMRGWHTIRDARTPSSM